MSTRAQIIRAVTTQTMTQVQAARAYNVSRSTVSKLLRQWRYEGDAAFYPKSRKPLNPPATTPSTTIDLITTIRTTLTQAGLDAGPATIHDHLTHHHTLEHVPSRATIARILTREGLITAEPKKRPKASLQRFEAELPNSCWQSDVTHYRLATGDPIDIITWLDDYSRTALHISAHTTTSVNTVVSTFTATTTRQGWPAATLTDNGMIYTGRFRGGVNRFEKLLRAHDVAQRNGRGYHPQTQGKVERFQQTMKKWLNQQPRPQTLEDLNQALAKFQDVYNTQRIHSAKKTTPWAAYISAPKDSPSPLPEDTTRYRTDRIDHQGKVSLRYDSRMYSIGIGRTHARTRVVLIIKDRHIIITSKRTGEVLKAFTLDVTRRYQKQ